jgi:hypothetical protein
MTTNPRDEVMHREAEERRREIGAMWAAAIPRDLLDRPSDDVVNASPFLRGFWEVIDEAESGGDDDDA